MTLEQLLAQLKALEASVQARHDYPIAVTFDLYPTGSGSVDVLDAEYNHWQGGWNFETLAELENVLAQALAEVRAK